MKIYIMLADDDDGNGSGSTYTYTLQLQRSCSGEVKFALLDQN